MNFNLTQIMNTHIMTFLNPDIWQTHNVPDFPQQELWVSHRRSAHKNLLEQGYSAQNDPIPFSILPRKYVLNVLESCFQPLIVPYRTLSNRL